MVWVGGMLFISLVAVPAMRGVEPPLRAQILSRLGRQFRIVGWTSIVVLVLTGLYSLSLRGVGLDDLTSAAFYETKLGSRLAIKFLLVGAMIALSLLHDFVLDPRVTQRAASAGDSQEAASMRRRVSWLARVSLVLGILVVGVSAEIAR